MLKHITWGTYIFFAAWLAIGFFFVLIFVPETKGKTLEEMDRVFGSYASQEDTLELARVQQEVGLTALLDSAGSLVDHVVPENSTATVMKI